MAVYTEISDSELRNFLASYEVGKLLSFKGIAEGVENSNYLLHTETGSYILTLYEKRVREADLPYFLTLMNHLAGKGIPSATPLIPHRSTAEHGSVKSDVAEETPLNHLAGRPAALITFLEGVSLTDPSPVQIAQVGEALARLHLAGQDFPLTRANTLTRPAWGQLIREIGEDADLVAPGLAQILREEIAYLDAHWPNKLPEGVIHADLFPDNVLFLENRVNGLIDFYFACNDSLAYDLAITLNAWCFSANGGAFRGDCAEALFQAYGQTRPLTAAEIQAFPLLARGAALRFLLTRLVDGLNIVEGALVKPKNPLDYLRILEFHQSITDTAELGLKGGGA